MTNPFDAAIELLKSNRCDCGSDYCSQLKTPCESAIRVLEAAGENPLDVAELLKAVLGGRGEKIDLPKDFAYSALPAEEK